MPAEAQQLLQLLPRSFLGSSVCVCVLFSHVFFHDGTYKVFLLLWLGTVRKL